ncbi:hypothetical protein T552_01726 [Pneumocystis carinii B80]|uniref:NEDD8-activating enzyme E1 regulatory subunit n=1 Tax=Pneumocystis carinii (strain B80) TaxID=1408658 RepID=A0A0W4ZJ93_PNEC8|nr:hypothetical protein T552_01726 [Pneumocystis carinii B80]KTW28465.1 hypothetical protein T552_01726 [Pneumocystis carinii B80]
MFFVDEDGVNEAKAPQICRELQELNEKVKGEYLVEALESILKHKPNFFKQFTIVISSIQEEEMLLRLENVLWEYDIPLIISYSVGFIGYLRITMPEHTIIETHEENPIDLRIDHPWAALKELASSFNLRDRKNCSYRQIPYVLILLNCLDIWKLRNNGMLPCTDEEKQQFKETIRTYMQGFDEESIEEVLSVSWRASCMTLIPDEIQSILKDEKSVNISSESSEFWILCHAISNYVSAEGKGLLPLSGAIPDMKSDSESYIKLQNVYRQKAQEDYECVRKYVQDILLSISQPISKISDEKIRIFCKQCKYMKILRYRSLKEEYTYPDLKLIESSFSTPDDLITWYIALRSYNKYKNIFGKHAGEQQATLDEDTDKYIQLTEHFLSEFNCKMTDFQIMACKELVRAGGGELHNIASFIGGVAAQEAIKEFKKILFTFKIT